MRRGGGEGGGFRRGGQYGPGGMNGDFANNARENNMDDSVPQYASRGRRQQDEDATVDNADERESVSSEGGTAQHGPGQGGGRGRRGGGGGRRRRSGGNQSRGGGRGGGNSASSDAAPGSSPTRDGTQRSLPPKPPRSQQNDGSSPVNGESTGAA